jgi:reactive intermediate/imine deaminase
MKFPSATAVLIVLTTLVKSASSIANATTTVEFLNSGKLLPKDLPFSEAVRVGDTLYLSGQIGVLPGTLEVVPGGLQAQAKQTMANIKTSLEANGYAMSDLVKCTVMLTDMTEWAAFNEIYKTYFVDRYPARSAFGANGLALGARVEVECIAVRPR